MSDKVSGKAEYEKAKEKIDEQEHTELYNAGTMNSKQYRAIIREYAMRREALALAEGERREREKERPKDVYSEGLTVGMGLGRQQALKEVEQKVIQERNISVVKTRTTGYETAELIGFDKAIGVIKQAIDQLRRKR